MKIVNAPAPLIPSRDQWDERISPQTNLELMAAMVQANEAGKNHVDITWSSFIKISQERTKEELEPLRKWFPNYTSAGVYNFATRFYIDGSKSYN